MRVYEVPGLERLLAVGDYRRTAGLSETRTVYSEKTIPLNFQNYQCTVPELCPYVSP